MLDAGGLRGLHHVERAHQIGVDIGARVFQAVANARLRGQMHDDVGLLRRGDVPHGGIILEHREMRAKRVRARQQSVARFLQGHVVIRRHAVEASDEMPVRDQATGEMEADEPGGAGDEKAHARNLVTGWTRFCGTCRPKSRNVARRAIDVSKPAVTRSPQSACSSRR